MKIISVVGARPQFIKAAPLRRALADRHTELLVHAGEHYDYAMDDDFFDGFEISRPDFNLAVGPGTSGRRTGELIGVLEELFLEQHPDVVVVYGGTDTTLAAALAAAKSGIAVAHVEAGVRSFDRHSPEELNRVLVDHLAEELFCPMRAAVANLEAEGITAGVHLVGDVALDAARFFADRAHGAQALSRFGVNPGEYFLASVRRPGNTESRSRFESIIHGFAELKLPVLWTVESEAQRAIATFGFDGLLGSAHRIRRIPPVGYADAIALLRNAAAVLTDSRGMQREAYFFGVPCLTLRDETEWIETVESGWNRLVGTDASSIVDAASDLSVPEHRPDAYGDGRAAEAIVSALEERFEA